MKRLASAPQLPKSGNYGPPAESAIRDQRSRVARLASRTRAFIEDVRPGHMIESVLLAAVLLTLLAYFFEGRPFIRAFQDLLGRYWKLFLGLILLVLVIRIWIVAGHRSVVVMPFDVASPSPVRGLTGVALSRIVFDEVKASLEGEQDSAGELSQKNLYQPEFPKAAQPAADLGSAVTLIIKAYPSIRF